MTDAGTAITDKRWAKRGRKRPPGFETGGLGVYESKLFRAERFLDCQLLAFLHLDHTMHAFVP